MDLKTRENSNSDAVMRNLYFNKYKPIKKLGEGSFGMIYMAENILTKEVYALKFEDRHSGQNLLESEAYVMGYLKGSGIPVVKSYGYSGDHNILVMELLGKSLEDLVNSHNDKKLSVKTVCMLAIQMLTVLEQIHSKHIIHRDIKPDNFVMGLSENEKFLYLLDFGLARKYRSSTTFQHYPMRNRKKLTGTARYASINALKGLEQSRRDDLEAVGYVLMYFLRGSLPWQGLPVKAREDRYRKIMEKKEAVSPEDLCQGFPEEFVAYIKYTRKLNYEEDPDYKYLRSLFNNVMQDKAYTYDYIYDWTLKGNYKASPSSSNLINNNSSEDKQAQAQTSQQQNTQAQNSILNNHNPVKQERDTNLNTNTNLNSNIIPCKLSMQRKNSTKSGPDKLNSSTNKHNQGAIPNGETVQCPIKTLPNPVTRTQLSKNNIKADISNISIAHSTRKSKKENKCCIY